MKSAKAPNYPILITLPYWSGDADMMRSVVKLCVGLQKEHVRRSCAFMLVARRDTPMDQDMVKLLATRFDVFTHQSNRFEKGWPQGPNGIFASTIIEVANRRNDVDCMFWLETDCVPMRPDWHQVLASEWRNRKPGVLVVGCKTTVDGSADSSHITGCALYDPKIALKMKVLTACSAGAWDWEHRRKILGVGQHTDRVHMIYRGKNADPKLVTQKNPPAVLHGIKDDSLLRLMSQKHGIKI